jgi:hypothetical protein
MSFKVSVSHQKVAGAELRDFPVLVQVRHDELRGARGIRLLAEDGTVLCYEVVMLDAASGELQAWVRVPRLSNRQDAVLVVEPSSKKQKPISGAIWDGFRFVAHGPTVERVAHCNALDIAEAITVEAWVDAKEAPAEVLQSLVSKWKSNEEYGAFTAYDASRTEGLDTTGFFGAVFDGRYVYFSPQYDSKNRHGKVLRYDTHVPFKDALAWAAYDATRTDGLVCQGYYGAVFDGRYVFFPPRRNPEGFHSRILRYDTKGAFHSPSSWSAYEIGVDHSSQSAAFDGRYIYLNPGQRAEQRAGGATDGQSPRVTGMSSDQALIACGRFIRHDTQGGFAEKGSYAMHDVAGTGGLNTSDFDGGCFDGRYAYFAPLAYAAALRYDTRADFQDKKAWEAYDCAKRFGMKRNVGVIFDGRHVYYVPYGECPVAVRFDTRRPFTDDKAWQAYELKCTPGMILGFDGACFDGRYVYYIPYYDEGKVAHGVFLRYDTQGDFADASSWSCSDATHTEGLFTGGFNAGAFDGRFIYCAPWLKDGEFVPGRIGGGGNVLRYDTTGKQASFDLRFCDMGHNGGLCAALPGPRFLINTEQGSRSIAANRAPPAGRHHFAGVYDGKTISLFIDGQLVNRQPATGRLEQNETDLAIGRVLDGAGKFLGAIEEIRISAAARDAEWLATTHANLADPAGFCRVVE